MTELIITEKPQAAKKIAAALADGQPVKKNEKGIPYYLVTHGKKDIIVGCAVGHLYSLNEKEKKGYSYPVYDIEWVPTSDVRKDAAFSKKYLSALKKLCKDANEFTVATDYDIEGEVIGLNVIRYACKKKDANRMKFSTLTKGDLVKAYEKKNKHLDWGQANAGETRHFLDWMYGINTSRALMSAIKKAGSFKIMSTGRVQGPALKILVDREKEIKAFTPVPFWQIELNTKKDKHKLTAWHKKDKFWEKKEADAVMKKVKPEKKAAVSKVEKKEFNQSPPNPFDLTTLQTECYRCHRIQPKETLSIAQELYTNTFISYPRTSSQKLPKEIGYKKIMEQLQKQDAYKDLVKELLKKPLTPNEGSKSDPAHPAIHPTGIVPGELKPRDQKVYDLIVRRFLATFGEPAIRETMTIELDVKEEPFIAKGTRTLEKAWHVYYGPYVKLEEEELPPLNKGDILDITKVTMYDKETSPPKRYTPASIIRELEKRNLGTKCLTKDTLVKIKAGNEIKNMKISKLFDSLSHESLMIKEKGTAIIPNVRKKCFSFNDSEEIESKFNLISRRKIKKHEKVFRIEYTDGSFTELTEDHPVLIFEDNKFSYIRSKKLKKGMKSVCSVKFNEKQGNTLCTWNDFLEKCNVKTRLYGISDEIKAKRGKISQYKFAKKYRLNQSSIFGYEKSKNIPLYLMKRMGLRKPKLINSVNKNISISNPFPIKMSSSLARMLANLVGDCSIDKKKIDKENCYDFRYHNTNIDLINRFVKDVRNVFGINLTIRLAKEKPGHLPKYYVRIPAVIGRIISILFSEVIKKNACQIQEDFYPEFIGALFDDEGHATKSEAKIFISNTNFLLLEEVKRMLLSLNIMSVLSKGQYKLYVYGRDNIQRFLNKIPIETTAKKQNIINNLTNKYSWKKDPIIKREKEILALLSFSDNNELTIKDIAKNIRNSISKTKFIVDSLRKKGLIKHIIIGIKERPRKRIYYRLVKPIDDIFYKYIDEKVISPDFITKTIKHIKKIDYSDYVYDITNFPETPNFILSNGVVVHNSTRATIIDTLEQRGYIAGKALEATDLGIKTCEMLEKAVPEILDEELTREFEIEMEEIREGKKTEEQILEKAKKILNKIFKAFKEKEKSIGEGLIKANRETMVKETTIGQCPNCKEGTLRVRKGKFGLFAACDKYPDCKTTISLPAGAKVQVTDKLCEYCKQPVIAMIKRGKRPQEVCINKNCPSKNIVAKKDESKAKGIKGNIPGSTCPTCKKGTLVLRKSIYGEFLGCDAYPKCKYTEKLASTEQKS